VQVAAGRRGQRCVNGFGVMGRVPDVVAARRRLDVGGDGLAGPPHRKPSVINGVVDLDGWPSTRVGTE
jgi:hypothetical protein